MPVTRGLTQTGNAICQQWLQQSKLLPPAPGAGEDNAIWFCWEVTQSLWPGFHARLAFEGLSTSGLTHPTEPQQTLWLCPQSLWMFTGPMVSVDSAGASGCSSSPCRGVSLSGPQQWSGGEAGQGVQTLCADEQKPGLPGCFLAQAHWTGILMYLPRAGSRAGTHTSAPPGALHTQTGSGRAQWWSKYSRRPGRGPRGLSELATFVLWKLSPIPY